MAVVKTQPKGIKIKTITINGVAFEATKEDLEKVLKEFDKPVWTIELNPNTTEYWLKKNGFHQETIWSKYYSFQRNYSQLIYKIANAMGVLASKEEILNKVINKERVHFDPYVKKFLSGYGTYIYGTTIKAGKASEIVELLNNSPLVKEFE